MSGAVIHLPRPILSPALRARVEQTIDWLVGLLDAVETPDDLEPSLGAPEQHTASIFFRDDTWHTLPPDQTRWAGGGTDEREGDFADAADDREGGDVLDDGEETLGWCENVGQGRLGPNTAEGDSTAPERHGEGFVRCGRDDYEPWLGAPETTHYGQTESQEFTWSLLGGANGSHDFEHDPAECGIADDDGLNEQITIFGGNIGDIHAI